MGFFSGIKSTYKKSEAAVVVQNLLEHQANSLIALFTLDPAQCANKLIEVIWNTKPDMFDGKFGQRPHKITVAAAALANGINLFEDGDSNRSAVILSLGNLLSEIETNGRLYPLNGIDNLLLEEAMSTFVEITEEYSDITASDEINQMMASPEFSTWEDWYKAYKVEAGKENSQLKPSDDGGSLLDFMMHEPLERAFKNGVDPRPLARKFAAEFDIGSFGQKSK